MPLSRAEHRPDIAAQALRLPYSALALTSAEPFRLLSQHDLLRDLDLEKPLFAVGTATANAATAAGFRTVHAGSGGGEELAALVALSGIAPEMPLLYLAGTPRATGFEDRLVAHGQAHRVADVYEMAAVPYAAGDLADKLLWPAADAVLLYSRENALRFFELAEPYSEGLRDLKVLCISDRTAGVVPPVFRGNACVAATPDEEALLALL
jgi:uroporphyrinogen-III synthase